MVTKTAQELDEMRELIADRKLPPGATQAYLDDEERNVFGHDHKKDANGQPIEQGIGSAAQPSRNSIDAYKQWCKDEPMFEENLARMEADFAAYEKQRKAR